MNIVLSTVCLCGLLNGVDLQIPSTSFITAPNSGVTYHCASSSYVLQFVSCIFNATGCTNRIDVTTHCKALCDGFQSCTLASDASIYGNPCSSPSTKTLHMEYNCIRNGGWTKWSAWSCPTIGCSSNDESVSRSRNCTNPPPDGGHSCSGLSSETVNCSSSNCAINGGWGNWEPWSCTITSPCMPLSDKTTRTRRCVDPSPQNGGASCSHTNIEEEESTCSNVSCPIRGSWNEWTVWSKCSLSCTQFRNRSCDAQNGAVCPGSDTELKSCSLTDKCSDTCITLAVTTSLIFLLTGVTLVIIYRCKQRLTSERKAGISKDETSYTRQRETALGKQRKLKKTTTSNNKMLEQKSDGNKNIHRSFQKCFDDRTCSVSLANKLDICKIYHNNRTVHLTSFNKSIPLRVSWIKPTLRKSHTGTENCNPSQRGITLTEISV